MLSRIDSIEQPGFAAMRGMFSRGLLVTWFATFAVLGLWLTRSWPYLGDATLIRYVVLSRAHHLAPYRDIHDINLSGGYLLDWLTLHLFGDGAIGLRCYDCLLLAAGTLAMWVAAPKQSKAAALCAGCLLALFHGRDGAEEIGQRDLAIAVLLLFAAACLVVISRHWRPGLAGLFGLCVGFACTIKPVALCILLIAVPVVRSLNRPQRRLFGLWGVAGLSVPILAMLGFLQYHGALYSFFAVLTVDIPFHARLGVRPAGWLIGRLFTSSLIVWTVSLTMGWWIFRERSMEERIVLWGIGAGALCYLLQLRGFNYHRYPFAACVLLGMALLVPRLLAVRGWLYGCGVGLLIYCAVLCPLFLQAGLKRPRTAPAELLALESDLRGDAGEETYQCVDTIGGCINALVDLHRSQATGEMYDEFLFHRALPPALQEQRSQFLVQLTAHPPAKIIVMSGLFPEIRSGYEKLAQWPDFQRWLGACYSLEMDRTFPGQLPSEEVGYRIFRLSPEGCKTSK